MLGVSRSSNLDPVTTMTSTSKIIIFVVAAIGLLGAYTLGQRNEAERRDERLAQMETRQEALQDAYLSGTQDSRAQLAQQLGYRRVPVAAPSAKDDVLGMQPPSPEQQAQLIQQTFKSLQQHFEAEQVNAAWSSSVRQNVEDAIDIGIQGSGARPEASTVDCRSNTCRIKLRFGEGSDPDALLQNLLAEIGGDLPVAQALVLPSPDGQRDLYIYAARHEARLPPPGI